MPLRPMLLILLAFALAASFVACGDSNAEAPPTATATIPADPLSTWLTAERQQLLLSTLKQLAPETGWVAGCVFESKADRSILSAINKPQGRAFFSEFTSAALGVSLAVRVEGTPAWTGDFVGASPNPQTYCYVPK